MLVTSALPHELAPFIRRLHDIYHPMAKNNNLLHGLLEKGNDSCEVHILFTGVGERAAAKSLLDALPVVKKTPLLISGTAGALTEKGRVGDIFIASNYGDPLFQRQLALIVNQAAAPEIKVWHEPLFTAGEPVVGRGNKAQLNNESGAFAVDMESTSLTAIAEKKGYPAAVLRVISDTLEDKIPPLNENIFDETGFPSRLRLAAYLLGHPLAVPQMITFSHRSHRACHVMAEVLEKIIWQLDEER
ncbi:MAG: hypothetical protein SVV67_04815 [Bacillota bacterium]|nr:hypothetical protein [Bacillota bacterium]